MGLSTSDFHSTLVGLLGIDASDGIHLSIRVGENKRIYLLDLVGVAENGSKQHLAVEVGYRESADSWQPS